MPTGPQKKLLAKFVRFFIKDALDDSENMHWTLGPDIPSVEQIEAVINANPNFDKMVDEGALIVLEVYSTIPEEAGGISLGGGLQTVGGISIEGIGPTPLQAAENFLYGVDEENVESLSNTVFEGFRNLDSDGIIVTPPSNFTRRHDADRGFFIKRSGESGKIIVDQKFTNIAMSPVRKKAEQSYISTLRSNSSPARSSLQKAYELQKRFRKVSKDFESNLKKGELDKKIDEALDLREKAIGNLERAQKLYEKSAKEARVAAGIQIAADLVSMAGSIISTAASEAARSKLNKSVEGAVNQANKNAKGVQDATKSINDLSDKIGDLQRSVVPRISITNTYIRSETNINIYSQPQRELPIQTLP